MDKRQEIPSRATGLIRVLRAAGYSWAGLCYTFKNEAAFRQEVFLCLILAPCIIFLPLSVLAKLYLSGCLALVLICELANTGLEVIINHISPDYSEAAQNGKDIGSALVFVALVNLAITFVVLTAPLVPSFGKG